MSKTNEAINRILRKAAGFAPKTGEEAKAQPKKESGMNAFIRVAAGRAVPGESAETEKAKPKTPSANAGEGGGAGAADAMQGKLDMNALIRRAAGHFWGEVTK